LPVKHANTHIAEEQQGQRAAGQTRSPYNLCEQDAHEGNAVENEQHTDDRTQIDDMPRPIRLRPNAEEELAVGGVEPRPAIPTQAETVTGERRFGHEMDEVNRLVERPAEDPQR